MRSFGIYICLEMKWEIENAIICHKRNHIFMEFSWSQYDWNIIYNKQINLKITMFSFHTHEVLSSIHIVESDFWEEMLDKIYSKVVQKHKSCLGLLNHLAVNLIKHFFPEITFNFMDWRQNLVGVKRKHDYFYIDLFITNDVSVKLASRELHENMISFVTYDGIFYSSFHFHVYVNTAGPHYCI